MLEINDIICSAPDVLTVIEGVCRFLGIDPQNNAYLIRLDPPRKKAKNNGEIFVLQGPFRVPIQKLVAAIKAGDILIDQQFSIKLPPTLEQLSAAGKAKAHESINLLRPLLEDNNILFDSEYRGRTFNSRAQECNIPPRKIRRLYYQYLWGGMTELAFAPEFSKRGGPGQPQKPGSARRGRKTPNDPKASKISLPAVRNILKKGAKLFFLQGSRTLDEAFIETKKKYFSKGANIERGSKLEEVLLPPDQLPSLAQFRFACDELRKELGISRRFTPRNRKKPVIWEFRGRHRDGVPGPGFRFEIDSTKVQIRVVSRYNRARTLKNATLYVIIDVWSGAIVGYALSFRNASWALAARALYNCFTDKQVVFDRLGLDYSSEDWPCHHLPSNLAADRAELLSNKAGLVPETGIKVEIMPPMCPQRKGKVEATINDIKHGHSHRIPGRHPKFRKRRETDGTDTAALTIDELETVIVEIIMGLNHDPVPVSYVPPEMVEEGNTDVTHIGLYQWGIQHFFGYTRKLSPTELYTGLMTKGAATLTNRGLYFKCQTFTSPELIYAATHKRASGRGRPLVDVRYDEHQANRIWFLNGKTGAWAEAINENEDALRLKAGFYELEIFRKEVQQLRRASKDESLHRKGERGKKIIEMVKQAQIEATEDKMGLSKASRRKNMLENTKLEITAGEMIASGATVPATKNEDLAPPKPNTCLQNNQGEGPPPPTKQEPNQEPDKDNPPKQSAAQVSLRVWEET